MSKYEEEKRDFLRKHGGLKAVHTSDMTNDSYFKMYEAEDGGFFNESNRPKYETVLAVVHGVTVETSVKLFCVEYWDTDNAKSRYHYEKY